LFLDRKLSKAIRAQTAAFGQRKYRWANNLIHSRMDVMITFSREELPADGGGSYSIAKERLNDSIACVGVTHILSL
jgi:hypothetical protein